MNCFGRLWSCTGLSLIVTACATPIKVPEIPLLDGGGFSAAVREPEPIKPVRYVEVPTPLPLPGQLKPVAPRHDRQKHDSQKHDGQKHNGQQIQPSPKDLPVKDRISTANAAARLEPVKDGYINAIQVYPYTTGALYQVYAAISQVTDIALEAGEKLVAVSAGDTLRWVVGDTTSGEGASAQAHILIKPVGADLDTNLVITTDRRTYHLELRSSDKTYMASVSWTYPASQLLALKGQQVRADATGAAIADTGINLEQLRFRYRLEGDAPWKPRQVFDDGAKVYIQFPAGLAQSEAPPLFVIGPEGKPALINYRIRGTTYIVDRLFAAAELRLGIAPQRIVRIVRTDAVWKDTAP